MPVLDLTLCMIVRDEQEHLGRCLSSVSGVVSEIIIVDTGSRDASVEIARSFGAQVLTMLWGNDFAAARNAGLAHATKAWILVLDADESWGATDDGLLQTLLEQPHIFGYNVPIISYVGAEGEEYVTDMACRLFRNDPRIRFAGQIHEEVASSILAHFPDGLADCELRIEHVGYLDGVIAAKNKGERNRAIIEQALQREPDNLQLLYALGTEFFQQGDYRQAIAQFEAALPKMPVSEGYASDLLLKLAYAWKELRYSANACLVTEKALQFFPDFADLLELRAMLLSAEGRYTEAGECLQKALQTGDISHKYASSSGAGTYRSRYLWGDLLKRQLCLEDACAQYEIALLAKPSFGAAWVRLLAIRTVSGTWDRLTPLLSRLQGQIPLAIQHILLEGALDLRQPEWIEHNRQALQQCLQNDQVAEAMMAIQHRQQHAYENLPTLSKRVTGEKDAAAGLAEWTVEIPRKWEADGEPLPEKELHYREKSQFLLRNGQWEQLLTLISAVEEPLRFSNMPLTQLCGMLQAPATFRIGLLAIISGMTQRADELMAFAGLLALELERYGEACRFFWALREKNGGSDQAATIGLMHAATRITRDAGIKSASLPRIHARAILLPYERSSRNT